jgi:sulfatase modifying factor 1
MRLSQLVALFFLALIPCAAAYATITIDTVPVGDAGNPKDPFTGNLYGRVNYAYNIGKYEVTVGQYTAFLNAVAATDTYSLYNTNLATDVNIAGISRSGASGSYTYSVIGSPNHAITFVNWGDAARFANWLNNGQPTGAEGPGTTETGAYTLNGATTVFPLMAITRNEGATWFIPTENEWYKAAYYQPSAAGGDSDSYWAYPMKTNSVPYSDQPPGATPDNTRVGNFYSYDGQANGYNDGYAITGSDNLHTFQNYLSDVGAYASSPSYYGTFDQAGNVFEWNENTLSSDSRGIRGGSWADSGGLRSDARDYYSADSKRDFIGFRVASAFVPEPSTAVLAAGIFALLTARRRRR